MKKPLSLIRNNIAKYRELHISVMAGLFTALSVGYLLLEIIPNQLGYNLIIIGWFMAILLVLFFIGYAITRFLYQKKHSFSYIINYFAGIISSFGIGLLLIYRNYRYLIIVIGAFVVVLYCVVSFFLLKVKRPK